MARHQVKTTSAPWQCPNVSTQRTPFTPGVVVGKVNGGCGETWKVIRNCFCYNHKSSQRLRHFLVNIAYVGIAGRFVFCKDTKQAVKEQYFEKKSLQNLMFFQFTGMVDNSENNTFKYELYTRSNHQHMPWKGLCGFRNFRIQLNWLYFVIFCTHFERLGDALARLHTQGQKWKAQVSLVKFMI